MTASRGWGFTDQHLALDALVSFVDGELTASAHDRAAAHVARCPTCCAEAAVQRNARTAVRSAGAPEMSPRLLDALRDIPTSTEMPDQPEGLALSEDGQFMTINRRDSRTRLGSGPVLGSSAPLGSGTPLGGGPVEGTSAEFGDDSRAGDAHPHSSKHGKRTRQGASVMFSGLVLGALALINLPADEQQRPSSIEPRTPHPGGTYNHDTLPASHSVPATGEEKPPAAQLSNVAPTPSSATTTPTAAN